MSQSLLNPDFREMLEFLIEQEVEFLLIGAYAMTVHGFPRSTGDMDLWMRSSPENASRVLQALTRFQAPLQGITAQELQTPDMVFQFGIPPRRIDLLTSISGVQFDDAWAARIESDVEGLRIPVLSRQHLIENKRATGRVKDRNDADWLEASP